MFCSNCGKTVRPEDTQCPHCHMALGDVRFPGIPYTSVQFRIVPGTPMPIDEAYAYTRTNYSVNIGDGQAPDPVVDEVDEDNVDGATTYRPLLRSEEPFEEEPEQEEQPEETPPPVDVVDPSQLTEEQIDQVLDGLKKKGLDADELTQTDAEPELEETADNGLSERMVAYENDMRAGEQRRQQKAARGKLKIPFIGRKRDYDGLDDADESYDAAGQYDEAGYDASAAYETPAPDAQDYDASAVDGEAQAAPVDGEPMEGADPNAAPYEDYGYDEDYGEKRGLSVGGFMNASVAGIRVANILKVVGGLVVVVVCLALGLKWFNYVNQAQQKSPIEGVTLALHTNGIAAIEANASTENITGLLDAYTNEGVVAFTAKVQQESDALQALMPEEPGVNDQLFIQALTAIETNIANAVTLDGIAGGTGSAESTARWAIINQSIESLKQAQDVAQLQAIVNGEKINVTVAEATPTPTPVTYTALTKGDESEAVKQLQQRLYDLGYLKDVPDGKFGTKTGTAVKYFQMAHDLTVSGIADSDTQTLLYSDEALDVQAGLAAYQARQNGGAVAPTDAPAEPEPTAVPPAPEATAEAGA